jgi:hypothetical protein
MTATEIHHTSTSERSHAEPTVTSIRQNMAGRPITELLHWPPDLFAWAYVVLEHSHAYRFATSPRGAEWPLRRVTNWSDVVEEPGRQWCAWAQDRRRPVPPLLSDASRSLHERAAAPLEDVARGGGLAAARGAAHPARAGRRGLCRAGPARPGRPEATIAGTGPAVANCWPERGPWLVSRRIACGSCRRLAPRRAARSRPT